MYVQLSMCEYCSNMENSILSVDNISRRKTQKENLVVSLQILNIITVAAILINGPLQPEQQTNSHLQIC